MKNFYYIVNGISHWFTGTIDQLRNIADAIPADATVSFWESKGDDLNRIHFVGL